MRAQAPATEVLAAQRGSKARSASSNAYVI
jgi:hypothetical protein